MPRPIKLDLLAVAAHPDDIELTCGGAVIKMVDAGYKVGILDLTCGETGTRGSVALRQEESARASKVMGIIHRENLGLPDAGVEHRRDYKLKLAQRIRALKPRTVILPYWEGRHPDHYTASVLGYEAAFLSGLAKVPLKGSAHRPFKIIYASLYRDVRPTFVVDITDQFETRMASLMAYKSQFTDQQAGSGIFPAHKEIRARVESMARNYGMLGGVTYAEPFVQKEVGLVEDVMAIPVKSI
jgi:bacillithiol biosynthesis deacetylase BshB1